MNIPSGLFRMKARAALKGHWQTALLISLVVNLPTLLMQAVSAYTGNDALTRLQSVFISASRDGVLTDAVVQNEIQAMLGSTAFWVVRAGELIAWLAVPCLALGMYKWVMDCLRGQSGPVSTVFCRLRISHKAIGLHLWVTLKILLWMLPGIALCTGMMFLFSRTTAFRNLLASLSGYTGSVPGTLSGASQVSPFALVAVTYFLVPVTIGAIAVPGVLAALRYALSEYILAEQPETGVLECVRLSKQRMDGYKKKLFGMMPVFLLWYLGLMMVSSMFAGMGVFGLVFQMLLSLVLDVYITASIAAFALWRISGRPAAAEAETEPPAPDADELN